MTRVREWRSGVRAEAQKSKGTEGRKSGDLPQMCQLHRLEHLIYKNGKTYEDYLGANAGKASKNRSRIAGAGTTSQC